MTRSRRISTKQEREGDDAGGDDDSGAMSDSCSGSDGSIPLSDDGDDDSGAMSDSCSGSDSSTPLSDGSHAMSARKLRRAHREAKERVAGRLHGGREERGRYQPYTRLSVYRQQEQVDLTIVSTSASLSAVAKKGMGVLLESPRKGEDGIEEAKKGQVGSDNNKRKKVLLESPSKNEDGTEEAKSERGSDGKNKDGWNWVMRHEGKELRGVVLKHFPTVDVALVSLDENVPGMVG
eukprot:g33856.t1